MYHVTHPNSKKYNYPLYAAIRKYGIENFEYKMIIELDCDEIQLREEEYKYIISFNSLSPNGYNQTLNTLHPLNDPLTYEKMKNTKRENAKNVVEINNNNEIINQWRSIVDCAEETKLDEKKIAACCRGERLTTGGRRFCWLNENDELEIKEYNRNPYKGAKGTTQFQITNKKVAKIDLQTGQILQTYDTIALASRENNCDSSGISKVCRGKRKNCGGYGWKYI